MNPPRKVLYVREIEARRLVQPLLTAIRRLRDEKGLLCGAMTEEDPNEAMPAFVSDSLKAVLAALNAIPLYDGPAEIVVMADPWPYDAEGNLTTVRLGPDGKII